MALGNLYRRTNRLSKAEESYDHALAIAREVSDLYTVGVILGNLAVLYVETGREPQSHAPFHEALAIARKFGEQREESRLIERINSAREKAGFKPMQMP